jgi:redox-regulated HSP33 family molecular chaperone
MTSPQLKTLEEDFSYEGVRELFPGTQSELSTVQFQCTCSRESVWEFVKKSPVEELEKMKEVGQGVNCHMCNESYYFSATELSKLLKKLAQDRFS